MAGKSRQSVGRSRWRRWIKASIFLLALLIVSIVIAPKFMARQVLQLALSSAELEPYAFVVETVGLRKLILSNVALGSGPDFSADQIEVTYDLSDLWQGNVEAIRLGRPVARAVLNPSSQGRGRGLSFGVLDPYVYGRDVSATNRQSFVSQLSVQDGAITVLSAGAVALTSHFDAEFESNGRLKLSFEATPGDMQSEPNAPVLSAKGRLTTTANGLQSAALDLNIARLSLWGWNIRGAELNANFEASQAEAPGEAMFRVQSLSLPKEWLARFERFLTPADSDADWVTGFQGLALAGRAALAPQAGGMAANLLEPVQLTGPDDTVTLTLSGGQGASPDLRLNLTDSWSFDLNLLTRQSGAQLPIMDLAVDATLTPDTTGQGSIGVVVRRLAGDFDSLRFGNLHIGGRSLDVSGKGNLRDFAGTAKGGLLVNGRLGESFGFEDSVAQLDGSFQLSVPGRVLYTHNFGACAKLKSRSLRLIRLYLPDSTLNFCPVEDGSVVDLALGVGEASAMSLKATVDGQNVLITDQDRFNLRGELPQIDLSTELDIDKGDWSLIYRFDGGDMIFGETVSVLDNLELDGIAEGSSNGISNVKVDLKRMRVSPAGEAELFAPFFIDGQMRTEERIGRFAGDLFDGEQRQMGGYVGEHDWRTQFGSLTFDTGVLPLKSNEFQPQILFPIFADMMADAKGAMRATGLIDWRDGSLKSNGEVELIDIDFASLVGPVSGVNSQIKLGSLLPLATLTPQRIDIQQIDVGIDLFFGEFLFSLMADGNVVLEEAVWPWAGGEIGFDRAALILDETPQELVLFVRAVDLAEVFALLDIDGLTGSGLLEGQLPIRVEGGGITVLDGVLTSMADGGSLSYQGPVSLSTENDDGSQLMFDALENFTYDVIRVSISGRTTDDLKVGILLEGSNPEVLNGYPFKINIATEGPLAEMVRQGTIGYRVPEQIRKQLQ